MEKSSIIYSALGRVVREGGFRIALIARYSAIPGHCMSPEFSHLNLFLTFRPSSHHCDIRSMRHEHLRFHIGCSALSSKAVHHCLYRNITGKRGQLYVLIEI
jgi:hypothetical protein